MKQQSSSSTASSTNQERPAFAELLEQTLADLYQRRAEVQRQINALEKGKRMESRNSQSEKSRSARNGGS